MPKHRSLSLKTFVHSIPWDLFQRYFEDLLPGQVQHHSDDFSPEQSLSDWSFLNEEVMEQFLGDSRNAEASGVILEQFRRINDIAVYGANLLVQAYQWAGATLDSEQTVQDHQNDAEPGLARDLRNSVGKGPRGCCGQRS